MPDTKCAVSLAEEREEADSLVPPGVLTGRPSQPVECGKEKASSLASMEKMFHKQLCPTPTFLYAPGEGLRSPSPLVPAEVTGTS